MDDIVLDPTKSKQLYTALLSAFPNKPPLERLVHFDLGANLNEFASSQNMEEVIFELMKWAKSKGKLGELILAAYDFQKDNPHLKAFAQQIGLDQEVWDTTQPVAPVTMVPFIVAAMTAEDTESFRGQLEETLGGQASKIQLESLKMTADLGRALIEYGYTIDSLLENYGAEPENWRPALLPQSTGQPPRDIRSVIEEIIGKINTTRTKHNPQAEQLEAEFLSSRFFREDDEVVSQLIDELAERGGILIVDPLSLLHERIGQKVLTKAITAKENLSTLVISPCSPGKIPVNQLIETQISNKFLWPAYRRFQAFDQLCEFGVGDLLPLQRWLFSALPSTAQRVAMPKESNKDRIRHAPNLSKHGVQRLFDQT